MLHDPLAQTLLALELCCRSLAQRILLIRELQAYAPLIGSGDPEDGAPVWNQEIRRHLHELPELEARFRAACAEHRLLGLSLGSPLAMPGQTPLGGTYAALQDLISAEPAQRPGPLAPEA